jgi:hypothetical protein
VAAMNCVEHPEMNSLIFERFGLDTEKIIDTLEKDEACKNIEWEKSNVYVVSTQEKVLDEAVRKSHFRSITKSENLFDVCEDLLLKSFINHTYGFSLVRNDVMHIKYQVGDFFKEHSDFLSLNSNIIEEFTLIISLLPTSYTETVVGGETRVKLNSNSITDSKATTTPGGALLFRKDLFHEGLTLEVGRKEILMVNVWGVRKSTDECLVVTFPSESSSHYQSLSHNTEEAAKTMFEREIKEQSKLYVIPVINLKDFPECFFSGYVEFHKKNHSGSSRVIPYACNVCSYEQFRVVYEVLSRQRRGSVSEKDLELLDFFSISGKAAFLELAQTVATDVTKSTASNEKSAVIEKDFVIFDSEEKTRVFADLAKQYNVPYAPFRIVYCEGETKTRGDPIIWSDVQMRLVPVLVTVGDYGNIYGVRHLPRDEDLVTKFEDLMPLKAVKIPDSVTVCRIKDIDDEDEEEEQKQAHKNKPFYLHINYFGDESNVIGLGLRLANNKTPLNKFLKHVCGTRGNRPGHYFVDLDFEYLPGRSDRFVSLSKYCHRDSKENVCFDEKEAQETSNYLAKSNFVERVELLLRNNQIHLHFPQIQSNASIFYCNEVSLFSSKGTKPIACELTTIIDSVCKVNFCSSKRVAIFGRRYCELD